MSRSARTGITRRASTGGSSQRKMRPEVTARSAPSPRSIVRSSTSSPRSRHPRRRSRSSGRNPTRRVRSPRHCRLRTPQRLRRRSFRPPRRSEPSASVTESATPADADRGITPLDEFQIVWPDGTAEEAIVPGDPSETPTRAAAPETAMPAATAPPAATVMPMPHRPRRRIHPCRFPLRSRPHCPPRRLRPTSPRSRCPWLPSATRPVARPQPSRRRHSRSHRSRSTRCPSPTLPFPMTSPPR